MYTFWVGVFLYFFLANKLTKQKIGHYILISSYIKRKFDWLYRKVRLYSKWFIHFVTWPSVCTPPPPQQIYEDPCLPCSGLNKHEWLRLHRQEAVYMDLRRPEWYLEKRNQRGWATTRKLSQHWRCTEVCKYIYNTPEICPHSVILQHLTYFKIFYWDLRDGVF